MKINNKEKITKICIDDFAIQISDRFYILKNVTEYCKQYLTKYFKAKVIINNNLDNKVKSKNIINYSQNEKALKAMQMFNVGIKKTKICETLKLNIKTLNKILKFNELDINYYDKSKLRIIQEERLKNKQEIINEAREMRKNCIPISKIAKALNLDRRTISKYLDEKTTGISTRLGVKRKSKLDQYINYIDKLIEIGVTSKTIYSKIKEMGYTGSESLIRNYKAQNKNNNYTSIVTT